MKKVVLIRPGMTESGRQGRKLGASDEPLLPEEMLRLQRCSAEGRYPTVHRVYVGSASRCRETASLLYPRMPAVVVKELTSFDCGEFEGKTKAELNRDWRYLKWAAAPELPSCPGGENLNWYAARCTKALKSIVKELENRRIETAALIAHGLVIDAIVHRICLPRTTYKDAAVGWGGGLVLNIDPAQFTAMIAEIL